MAHNYTDVRIVCDETQTKTNTRPNFVDCHQLSALKNSLYTVFCKIYMKDNSIVVNRLYPHVDCNALHPVALPVVGKKKFEVDILLQLNH